MLVPGFGYPDKSGRDTGYSILFFIWMKELGLNGGVVFLSNHSTSTKHVDINRSSFSSSDFNLYRVNEGNMNKFLKSSKKEDKLYHKNSKFSSQMSIRNGKEQISILRMINVGMGIQSSHCHPCSETILKIHFCFIKSSCFYLVVLNNIWANKEICILVIFNHVISI